MSAAIREQLVQAALAAQQQAYARYSQFHVGAALLADDGRIFTGCNVENASYGLTICAERVAVFNGVVAGAREFQQLAIATRGGSAPCGACRQVLVEFSPQLPILLINSDDPTRIVETNLRDLLPRAFGFSPPES